MSLLSLVITLLVVGVLLYLINRYIPMDPTAKRIINIAVVVILVIWILKILGFWGYISNVTI
jgi:hypothetical protein